MGPLNGLDHLQHPRRRSVPAPRPMTASSGRQPLLFAVQGVLLIWLYRRRVLRSERLHSSRTAGIRGKPWTESADLEKRGALGGQFPEGREPNKEVKMPGEVERSSRLAVSWAGEDWRAGYPQVRRALPTRSGGCCSGSAARPCPGGRVSVSSGGRSLRWRG